VSRHPSSRRPEDFLLEGKRPGRSGTAARACVGFAWLTIAALAAAAEAEVVELGEGVYARIVDPDSTAVGNAGFVWLDPGVVVFDAHFTPEAGRELATEVRKATSAPVRFLVNSHFHPDHTHGSQAFAAAGTGGGAPDFLASLQTRRAILQKDIPALNRGMTVAHEQIAELRRALASTPAEGQAALRAQIAQRQAFLERVGGLRVQAPLLAVEDFLEIGGGKRAVELRYLGRGHTEGDLVLVVPSARVVFTGDLFYNDALPAAQDAYLLDWITTLGALLQLDVDTFVPGHGRPGTREDVKRFLRYLEDLKALVQPAAARGVPVESVLRGTLLPAEYGAFRFRNFFAANVQKMYQELRAASAGAAAGKPATGAPPRKPASRPRP
jgi:glyoxylase-like metal-dependent hydrolase (beta-lactamase superfamily II)